jgi:hypothetical protein
MKEVIIPPTIRSEAEKEHASAEPAEAERLEIKELIKENQLMMEQNNMLLRKLHKIHRWGFIMRIVWICVLLGAPLLIYYYLIEPYVSELGVSLSGFEEGLQQVPGWGQFYESMGGDPRSE